MSYHFKKHRYHVIFHNNLDTQSGPRKGGGGEMPWGDTFGEKKE